MPNSSCDENRLYIAQEAEEQFERARKLAAAEQYDEALECYLFAFDNGRAVSGWGGVLLSYIPSEIAELGVKYPPAREALLLRRNAREKLILNGTTDYDTVSEWLALNEYLGEKERELELLDELQKQGAVSDSLRAKIIDSNFERLLEARRYDLLAEYLDHFGSMFLMLDIFHFEESLLFPEKFRFSKEEYQEELEFQKETIRVNGARIFELALGVGKEFQANEIVKRILLHCPDAKAYSALIEAAGRAGKKKIARELLKQAKTSLNSDDYKSLQKDLAEK